ncbi:MAG: hypothetical protein ACJAZN_002870 [Planctomycetota bacterium]|jgi:hypothetical protein
MMVDRDLDDVEAVVAQESGQEPVHPLKERERPDWGPPEHLERAARVTDRVRAEPPTDAVAHPGAEPPQATVAPISAPADHGVVPSGAELLDHTRHVRRVVLKIRIDRRDARARCDLKARRNGRRLTAVSSEEDPLHPRVSRAKITDDPGRIVPAPIIDQDQLPGTVCT